MHGYKRADRVGEQIQQTISRIVQELREPGIGFVTVTGVKLTDDLRDARVFFSVIGSDEEVNKSCEIMKNSAREIRHQLAMRLNLRHTPILSFEFDSTPAYAAHICELLDKIKDEDSKDKLKPEKKKGTRTANTKTLTKKSKK